MRQPYVAGNWKMYKTVAEAVSLTIYGNVHEYAGLSKNVAGGIPTSTRKT